MDRPRPANPEPVLGGDRACWLEIVCDACGQVRDDVNADRLCPACAAPALLTIGHGTATPDELLARLRDADTAAVVDVRRYPDSRRNPRSSRSAMQQWLPDAGIDYRWDPRLGGRRTPRKDSPHEGLRNRGLRAYADHMLSAEFHEGIEQLLIDARSRPTAILCAESVWWKCHRRLIADAATLLHDLPVIHLMPDRRQSPHVVTDAARVHDAELIYEPPYEDGSLDS